MEITEAASHPDNLQDTYPVVYINLMEYLVSEKSNKMLKTEREIERKHQAESARATCIIHKKLRDHRVARSSMVGSDDTHSDFTKLLSELKDN